MSTRLNKVQLVKGLKWERLDPLDNVGVSTYELIRDAVKEGRVELAKDLVDYLYFWEIKLVRDANIDLAGGFPQFYMSAYGEDGFDQVYRETMARSVYDPASTMAAKRPAGLRDMSILDWTMAYAARMVRIHRMGKNDGVDGFVLEEYDDRYEVVWDPCYTGGRTRRGDSLSGKPPHTGPPYNYAGNQKPHPWTWGKSGVSGYCIHCCVLHELMDVEQTGGYLQQWVTGYSENPWDPCRYIAYKDVDWVPDEYYTRIGKSKPRPASSKPRPENPKLLKVTHSNELGTKWQNLVPRLKRAIDTGKKDEALELVDRLDAETGLWHLTYPLRSNWTWMDLIVERYGYNELYHCLRSIPSTLEPLRAPDVARPRKSDIPGAELRARRAAAWGRSDRSGPDESSVRIVDEPDRIVMELDPCGSVGRHLVTIERQSEVSADVSAELGMHLYVSFPWTPLTESPYNAGVTTERHPVAWNKVGIPHLCTRCCVHVEMAALAQTGYLTTVVERPEDVKDPTCRWFFYKDPDDVPEEYYTRIGARKPVPER